MAAGSIVRLKLKNFMTYHSLEIRPCPGLNLITGPNGTGKSSLLCAMCLSLGGKPASIGRVDKISDFIKSGCDKACIETELFNPEGENVVIERIIHASNNSHWVVNGKSASLKTVEKEVAKFNIQTGNLCQFLPQEKVADFTKMNQKELLESTEQAVGDQSMFDSHVKLKNMRTKYCEIENNLKGVKENLERDIESNKRLEGEVKQHQERQKHLKKIKSLEKKMEWMKYDDIRSKYMSTNEEKKALVKKYNNHLNQVKPLQKQMQQIDQKLQQIARESEEVNKEIRKKKANSSAVMQKLEEVDSKVSDLKYEINEKIKDEKERSEKIQNARTVLLRFEEELHEAKLEEPNTKRELQKIADESKHLHYLHMQAEGKMNNCKAKEFNLNQSINEVKKSIEKLQQDQYYRLNFLRNREPDAYEAIMWLRANKTLFKKNIYEPILTLIDVPDPRAVKYIENHIAYRDLIAFFAEDPDDMNKFLRILSDGKGLNINGIYSAPIPQQQLHPKMSKSLLQNLGLTYNLGELFCAPPLVMNYLQRNYRLHDIPVGYEYTPERIKNILGIRRFPFTKFFLGDFMYKIKTSKYGDRNKSSTSQKIADNGLLRGSVDMSKLQSYKNQLQELTENVRKEQQECEAHSQNEKNLNVQIEALRVQKKALLDKGDSMKNLFAKVQTIRQQLRSLEIPVCNIEEEETRLSNFIAASVVQKIKLISQLNALQGHIFYLEKEEALKCVVSHYFLLKKKDDIDKALENASAECRAMEKSLQQVKNDIVKLKSDLHMALANAKKTLGLKSSEDIPANLTEKIRKEFENLPDTIAELESEVNREQARLNCIYQTNPAVIDEYAGREKHINETKVTIATKEKELEELGESINSIRDEWLPAIETLIKKISTKFSRYFASLGCAGEVTLDKTDNPNDFEKYGISIKVKFRDEEPLSQLSHAHHSGGECSVSTILYILSLQELTEVPFRCVDEINQGMDSLNERNVFDLIVKSSCSKKKSQYFLITPKLLHGLEYPPEMEIAIIHNGSSGKCHWNISDFLRIKSSMRS